jgi:hypothetical protein
MALDFPANPVDGEAFSSYIWSESRGAWKAREESAAVSVISPTAPTSGSVGDIWYNSNSGTPYIYYDDGDTVQWVELIASSRQYEDYSLIIGLGGL